jgi:hypothetical protein
MVAVYKTHCVERVLTFLLTKDPHRQILKIRDVTGKPDCPERVERLEEFPDIPVPSGTRVYQDFDDGRIFEICIVRRT